jgi:hypothetical protein|tara:strand:- start:1 stop:450 length:450 start_codon:yes stop_codon:yes gene_type:complete
MAGKLAASLTALIFLVGCVGVEVPTVAPEPPSTVVAPEKEKSIEEELAFTDRVALLLHIDFKDGSYQDMMGMGPDNVLILQPRYLCEAVVNTEVIKMIVFLNQRNVPIKSVKGFCVDQEEMEDHTATHPKPTNGRPPWIPNMPTIEVSN